jgi:hypothetical protein
MSLVQSIKSFGYPLYDVLITQFDFDMTQTGGVLTLNACDLTEAWKYPLLYDLKSKISDYYGTNIKSLTFYHLINGESTVKKLHEKTSYVFLTGSKRMFVTSDEKGNVNSKPLNDGDLLFFYPGEIKKYNIPKIKGLNSSSILIIFEME